MSYGRLYKDNEYHIYFPLHAALRRGADVTEFSNLINDYQITIKDGAGSMPLHLCLYKFFFNKDYPNIVLRMLELGADVHAKDCNNKTPLNIALEWADWHAVVALLKHGAQPGKTDLDIIKDRFLRNDDWEEAHCLATGQHYDPNAKLYRWGKCL